MKFVAVRPTLLWVLISIVPAWFAACGSRNVSTSKKESEKIGNSKEENLLESRKGSKVGSKKESDKASKEGRKVKTMQQFAPLDTSLLANLSKTEIPGLQRDPGRPPQGGVLHVSYHSTDSAVPFRVHVVVRGCDKDLCAPLELDQWRLKEKHLPHYTAHMTKAFEDNPKKVMEVSILEFQGHKAVAFYWFGFSRRHTHGVTMTSATNDLFAYYNAGDKALIMVTVVGLLPKGPGPKDLAGFKQSAPAKKVLEDAAVKAIEAFSKGL